MFSVGASKLAESALKFGEIASQKVVQVSETVGEKVKCLSNDSIVLCTTDVVYFVIFYNLLPTTSIIRHSIIKHKGQRRPASRRRGIFSYECRKQGTKDFFFKPFDHN